MPGPRPLRLLARLLLRPSEQEVIIGDLEELYARRAKERGVVFAGLHYLREVLSSAVSRAGDRGAVTPRTGSHRSIRSIALGDARVRRAAFRSSVRPTWAPSQLDVHRGRRVDHRGRHGGYHGDAQHRERGAFAATPDHGTTSGAGDWGTQPRRTIARASRVGSSVTTATKPIRSVRQTSSRISPATLTPASPSPPTTVRSS